MHGVYVQASRVKRTAEGHGRSKCQLGEQFEHKETLVLLIMVGIIPGGRGNARR